MDVARDAVTDAGDRLVELVVLARPQELHHLRRGLDRLELPPEIRADARLLLTELVTNSIRHAGLRSGDPIRVRAIWDEERLRVDVHDGSRNAIPGPVAGAIRPSPMAEAGWGLFFVDRLSSRWGTSPGRHWFELETPESVEA